MSTKTRTPRQTMTPYMLAVLKAHPGEKLTTQELVRLLNEEQQVKRTAKQVSGAAARLAQDTRFPEVEVVGKGIYTYNDDPSMRGDRMFSEVGITKEGKMVLECTDGNLYIAEQL